MNGNLWWLIPSLFTFGFLMGYLFDMWVKEWESES